MTTTRPNKNDIRSTREAVKLSQTKAALLVHTTRNTWMKWESGERRMHPGLWELFTIKAAPLIEEARRSAITEEAL